MRIFYLLRTHISRTLPLSMVLNPQLLNDYPNKLLYMIPPSIFLHLCVVDMFTYSARV